MDDLLREFLTETSESLDTVDNQLVKFEQEPNNARILDRARAASWDCRGWKRWRMPARP
jgi:chemotaxis protein histidine kinase CheA